MITIDDQIAHEQESLNYFLNLTYICRNESSVVADIEVKKAIIVTLQRAREIERGEYICAKCGLRQDAPKQDGGF
jgi:hypothetical protein